MKGTYQKMLKTTKNQAFGRHIGFSMEYVTPTTNMMRKMDSPGQNQSDRYFDRYFVYNKYDFLAGKPEV